MPKPNFYGNFYIKSKEIKKSFCLKQWDQIGLFLKYLATNFLAKLAKMYGNFLVYFQNCHFSNKKLFGYFRAIFENVGLLFNPTSSHTDYSQIAL